MLKLYTSEFIRIVLNAHQIFTLNTDFNKLLIAFLVFYFCTLNHAYFNYCTIFPFILDFIVIYWICKKSTSCKVYAMKPALTANVDKNRSKYPIFGKEFL